MLPRTHYFPARHAGSVLPPTSAAPQTPVSQEARETTRSTVTPASRAQGTPRTPRPASTRGDTPAGTPASLPTTPVSALRSTPARVPLPRSETPAPQAQETHASLSARVSEWALADPAHVRRAANLPNHWSAAMMLQAKEEVRGTVSRFLQNAHAGRHAECAVCNKAVPNWRAHIRDVHKRVRDARNQDECFRATAELVCHQLAQALRTSKVDGDLDAELFRLE